jgi:hypothetical protein
MKRTRIFLVPPFVFALTAILTWFAGAPAGHPPNPDRTIAPGPHARAAAAAASGGLAEALLQLERNILPHNPAPPRGEIHDAEGMEKALRLDERTRWTFGGGMAQGTYAIAWADEAPEAMFAWLIRKKSDPSQFAQILFESWAAKNMKAALAAVPGISDPWTRGQALFSCLEILATRDPDRARELLAQNLSLFATDGATPSFYGFETATTTIALLQSLPPGKERTRLLAGCLSDDDFKGTAQTVWKQAADSQRREWLDAGFSPSFTVADSFEGLGDLMRERAESSGDCAAAEKFLENHGEAWARRDLAAALDWALSRLKGRRRVETLEKFFQAAVGQDRESALRVLQAMPEGCLKERAAGAIRRCSR